MSRGPYAAALADFLAGPGRGGWGELPFFRDGAAARVAAAVDDRVGAGATVLPAPAEAFAALATTPLDAVKVAILGQDPYPTPGDAHGLAFSLRGAGRLPPSLKAILLEARGSAPERGSGDLTGWARQGVLLLNTALTVEAGRAGAHLDLGWERLADEAVAAVSRRRPGAVFMLWGAKARARAASIDRERCLVLEAGHPSPLNRARDFPGCGHFARANAWLERTGLGGVDWSA